MKSHINGAICRKAETALMIILSAISYKEETYHGYLLKLIELLTHNTLDTTLLLS